MNVGEPITSITMINLVHHSVFHCSQAGAQSIYENRRVGFETPWRVMETLYVPHRYRTTVPLVDVLQRLPWWLLSNAFRGSGDPTVLPSRSAFTVKNSSTMYMYCICLHTVSSTYGDYTQNILQQAIHARLVQCGQYSSEERLNTITLCYSMLFWPPWGDGLTWFR